MRPIRLTIQPQLNIRIRQTLQKHKNTSTVPQLQPNCKLIIMKVVEINDEIKPFSLRFPLSNLAGTPGNASKEFITFKQVADEIEAIPFYFKDVDNNPKKLKGILCTIDPEQNKVLKKNYYTLQDRTQSFTYMLDEQIDKLAKLGPKLGLSFNNTLNIFSTTFDVSHCISTFVDLVPTKPIQIIKDQIEDLLGKDAFIHTNNIADTAKLVKQIGQEMDNNSAKQCQKSKAATSTYSKSKTNSTQ